MTGLGSSCGACKFLRRRCTSDCVFAPYFCYDEAAAHFAAVHKVFGASNVSKILSYLPMHNRSEAAISISYEALARMQDPVYGCVAQIFVLQQQVASLQEEIELLENQMALAVQVSSVENSQVTNNINNELHFSSQQDEANVGSYLSQQPPDFSHELISGTSANHAFCSQMNIHLPPVLELEDQTSTPYSNSSSIERLLAEMHQGIFTSYPWRNNGSNTN